MIAPFVADIPKAEIHLSVRRGNFITIAFYNCSVKSKNHVSLSDAPKRCWKKIETDLPGNAQIYGVTKDQLKI